MSTDARAQDTYFGAFGQTRYRGKRIDNRHIVAMSNAATVIVSARVHAATLYHHGSLAIFASDVKNATFLASHIHRECTIG